MRTPAEIHAWNRSHAAEVVALCEREGYGFVMGEAAIAWKKKDPRGAIVMGPCATFVVPCVCDQKGRVACNWCCASGWLTKDVRDLVLKEIRDRR